MISRRLLRLRIMQIVYAYFLKPTENINQVETELFNSIHKTYELFHYLMSFSLDLRQYAQNKQDTIKNRYIRTKQEVELNNNFLSNKLLTLIESNHDLQTFLNNYKFSWVLYPELTKNCYNTFIETNYFKEYQQLKQPSFKEDKEVIAKLYTEVIATDDEMIQSLEEMSIYWNDDFEFVISNVVETLNKFKLEKGAYNPLPAMYKCEDDISFVKNLFRKCILHHNEHREIIEKYLKNWEADRIAVLDMIILELALTELYCLDDIPVKVTLNEYIDLSKYYSTEKSSVFINGILDKIVHDGRADGKIVKRGKGLIGETK